MGQVKEMFVHQKKNFEQGDVDVLRELEWEAKQREAQHSDNQTRDADRKLENAAIIANQKKIEDKLNHIFIVVSGFGTAVAVVTGLRWLGLIHVGIR